MPFLIGLLLVFLLCALIFGYQGARAIFIGVLLLIVGAIVVGCVMANNQKPAEVSAPSNDIDFGSTNDATNATADANAATNDADTNAASAQPTRMGGFWVGEFVVDPSNEYLGKIHAFSRDPHSGAWMVWVDMQNQADDTFGYPIDKMGITPDDNEAVAPGSKSTITTTLHNAAIAALHEGGPAANAAQPDPPDDNQASTTTTNTTGEWN